MKKMLAMILALAMVLSMSVCAFAATISTQTGNESQPVTVNMGTKGIKYHVVITWAGTTYTYDPGTWNPGTHVYENSSFTNNNGNKTTVTVENHTNADVKCTIEVTDEPNDSVTVSADNNVVDETLESADAVGRLSQYNNADSVTVNVTPTGTIGINEGESGAEFTIATITVTIAH